MIESPFKQLLTIEQAAELLEISEPTLYRMISEGRIAAIRHGGRSWFEPDEIIDYVARLRAEAAKMRALRARKREARSRTRAQAPPKAAAP